MTAGRLLARITIGVAGATFAASALVVPLALAQSQPPQGANVAATAGANRSPAAGAYDDFTLPTQAPAEPDLRRSSDGDDDPSSAMGDGTGDPTAVPQDGDLTFPRDPTQPVDGSVADGQPAPNRNLTPTQLQDIKDGNLGQTEVVPGSDADTGNSPGTLIDGGPNGRPSIGFETEFDYVNGTNALTRATRAFTAQPYDPLGISIGSFRMFPQLEASGVYFGNVFRANSGAQKDAALDLKPTIRVVSNWPSHLLDVTVSGERSYHNQFPDEDDKSYTVDAKGRIDITKRANVELRLLTSDLQEQRGSVNDPSTAGSRVDDKLTTFGITYNQRFNRLSLQVRGSITDNQFSGGLATTPERNFTSKDTALRASYELKGGFSVFAEEAGNWRQYEQVQSSDGIKRDSSGTKTRGGLALATTYWTGEASIGYARQDYADSRLGSVEGLMLDSSLTWRPSASDAVLFTATSQIGESTLANSGGSVVRNIGAEYRHNFTRYWLVSGGVVFSSTSYAGAGIIDNEWISSLGTEYYLSREVVLFGKYDHFDFSSTQASRDFTDDQLRVGVRIRQ